MTHHRMGSFRFFVHCLNESVERCRLLRASGFISNLSCLFQVGKLKEIEEINEDVEILKLCGILVDNEENTDDSSSEKR